jgi:hypothetical protein
MLIGIPSVLSPELLKVLMEMGHGGLTSERWWESMPRPQQGSAGRSRRERANEQNTKVA